MRDFAGTKRFHTKPTIGHQTVAEHSYYVAMLCIRLSGGAPTVELLKAALYHDLAESRTGDVPAPAKWMNLNLDVVLREMEREFEAEHGLAVLLTYNDQLILKHADAMELAFYCVDQLMLGNRHMKHIYHVIVSHIDKLEKPDNKAEYEAVYEELKEKYYDATT